MLAQKLQNDRTKQAAQKKLRAACAQQIQDLHSIFVQWFRGTRPLDVLQRELKQRLTAQFSHVAPNGQFLSGRQVLLGHLIDKYACYRDRVFDIEIYNVQVIWQEGNNNKNNDDNKRCLVTYEEWQSWQREDGNNNNNNNAAAAAETQQFGRLSTCLLEMSEPAFKWIHVHETWLEEEVPAPDAEKAQDIIAAATNLSDKEDDSIMTGPVMPPTMNAADANGGLTRALNLNSGAAAAAATAGGAAAIATGRVDDDDNDDENENKEEEEDNDTDTPIQNPFDSLSKVLVLISKTSQASNPRQQEALQVLQQHGLSYSTVDGSDPDQRSRRNALFRLSGKPGLYPQFFLMNNNDEDEKFWGDWDRFQQAVERGNLTAELLSQNVVHNKNNTDDNADADADDDDSEDSDQSLAAAVMGGALAATVAGSSKAAAGDVNKLNDAPDWATASELNKQNFPEPEKEQQQEEEEEEEKGNKEAVMATGAAAVVGATTAGVAAAMNGDQDQKTAETGESVEQLAPEELEFLEASKGILVFEEEEESQPSERPEDGDDDEDDKEDPAEEEAGKDEAPSTPTQTPIPNDVSAKRHVSPKLKKYAKPMMWQGTMVGISLAGFDIGTSQGPIADETWYKENGARIEDIAQSINHSKPRRRICLPEMVYPVAHVALEGNGVWLSWDATDALESWAKCHQMISVLSRIGWNGVNVIRSSDAKKWEDRRLHVSTEEAHAAVFHYDWTFATPYCGTMQGGEWVELDESGMRMELLKDQSVPILFFDDIILYEDDLHDNGQCQYSVKLRVMPTCAYILARLWVRVDNIIVRLRETRVLIDFFGMKPQIYRDVAWRECAWENLQEHNLPTDVRSWQHNGPETPAWNMQLHSIPEVEPPKDAIMKHAILEYSGRSTSAPFEC